MGKSAKFAIRINSDVLHALLQQVAQRAYLAGLEDGKAKPDAPLGELLERVAIDPSLLRKFA